jgi:hypothetical protein
MTYRKIIKKTMDIERQLSQSGYKEISNHIFIKKSNNKNVVIATAKNYIIFGISSLA